MSDGLQAVLSELIRPFADPGSRTAWFALLGFVGVAVAVHLTKGGRWRGLREAVAPRLIWSHKSTRLDLQLLIARQLIGLLGFGVAVHGSTVLATQTVRTLDATAGRPDIPVAPVAWLFPVVLFLAWDLSRYVVHRLMHTVPALWSLHQVHHSAEVLSPLTFHRVHPVESLLYAVRGLVVTGLVTGVGFWLFRAEATDWSLLGVNGVGLLLNVVTGNLRHSHLWLRFPAWLETWFISPAQHQLHHVLGHDHVNYGTWLAVWDRLAGSWARAPQEAPDRFGVAERNHGNDLVSAWFGPLAEVIGKKPRWLGAFALVLMGREAQAEEEEDVDDDVAVEIMVLSDTRTSRIAGSAHKLDERDLDLFEQSNIEDLLATVPGVYSRGEDGFGLRPNIGIRGANSDRSAKLTLLEDGVPAAPAPYAAPAAYYFPMVTRMVGVEIFKGPAAVMTGPQTVGGAINMLTRRAPSKGTTATVDLATGLRNTGRLHAFVGHGEGRVSVLGEVAMLTTTGFKQLDGGGPTGFLRGEGMFKARVISDPAFRIKHALEVKVGYAAERSNETYLGLSVDDLDTPYRRYAASNLDRMGWGRTQLEVSWPIELGDDIQIRTTAYHHELDRSWTKVNRFAGGPDLHDLLLTPDVDGQGGLYLDILRGVEDSQSADQRIQLGTNDRHLVNFGLQSTMRWSSSRHREKGPSLEHRLTAGLRLHGDRVDRLHTENPFEMQRGAMVAADAESTVLLDAVTRADALALFMHEDLQIGRLSLLPGLRVEAVRTQREDAGVPAEDPVTRATPLPGAGVLFEIARGLQVFGGVYRGFSPVAPGAGEEVRPEYSWNYEGGARVGIGEGPHAEVVYFQNEYLNLTGQCTVSGGCLGDAVDAQFNGGAVRLQGVEAVAGTRLMLPAHLTVPVNATYTFTRGVFLSSFDSAFPQFDEVEAGFFLPYVPQHQAGGILALEHPMWRLGLEATGRTGMRDAASAEDADLEIPGITQLGAAFHLQVAPTWQVYVTGSNLTARQTVTSWRPFGARTVAPTQLMLGVRWDAP